jgi:hypothetical protein
MPGYVIHLAVAKEYMKHNEIQNEKEFLKGAIAPDMLNTKDIHYGMKINNFDINEFKKDIGFDSSYGKGYYLHLISDYIFYYKYFLNLTKAVHADYDVLNEFLIKKYEVEIPTELIDIVKFNEGTPKFINLDLVCKFIDEVSKINLEQSFSGEIE